MSLVDYCSSSGSSGSGASGSEAEEEPEATTGPRGSLHRQAAAASGIRPRPVAARKRGGGAETVRIPAPDIIQSDSDDDEPVHKRTSQGLGSGLGLSALLPQPRNLAVKEMDRTLLPYPFTKSQRPAAKASGQPKGAPRATVMTTPSPSAIKAASKNAAKQLAKHIMNEEASEEEEEQEEVEADRGEGEEEEEDEGDHQAVSFFSLSDARNELSVGGLTGGEGPVPALAPAVPPDPLNPADAPLEFNRSSAPAPGGSESVFPPGPGLELGSQYPAEFTGPGTEQAAPPYYQDYYSNYYQEPDPALTAAPDEELNTFMNDEAFKRLQGKRNRGKEEVSFLEIKGDEQLSGSQQWLMKSLSEEKDMKSFSKKRGEQPTSQQRRKHQITYLIHQAKERELELKNAWSDNRLTKRQTQAKYGF